MSIYGNGARHDRLFHVSRLYFTIRNVTTGQVLTPNAEIYVDPCNRQYSNHPGCWRDEGSNTASIQYRPGQIPTWRSPEGNVINLLTAPLHSVGANGSRSGFTVPASGFCTIEFGEQVSPLVIDLTGGGVVFTDPSKEAVRFNLGQASGTTAWIANPESVAFLALDRNENGAIDDINELFGDRTTTEERDGFSDGFWALAEHDANKDGVITKDDPIFDKLLLWNDFNVSGRTEAGELSSVSGVLTSLSVKASKEVYFRDSVNNYAQGRSTVIKADGASIAMYDAWFIAGPAIPVGELSGTKKVDLPKVGSKEFARVRQDLFALLRDDGWGETDTAYEQGEAVLSREAKTSAQQIVMRWTMNNAPECFAQLRYTESWSVIDRIVACDSRSQKRSQ
jgi:hypothetical protein